MKVLVFGTVVVLLLIGVEGMQFYKRFRISKELVQNTKPFSYSNDAATKRLLVVGDSTAVGIGSAHPEESITGRFHADYPMYAIENRAISGQKLADTLAILQGVDNFYDIILIQSGANDILFLTPKEVAVERARLVLTEARRHASIVVFLTSGNIGLSPLSAGMVLRAPFEGVPRGV